MKIDEAEVNRKVVYTPFKGCDPKLKEEGVITSKNDKFVFVRYESDVNSKATSPCDICYL